ncbi:MAG: hypothetical protein HY696_05180 [Deltaproteobacteria bacterium]|nr:hypothetical protein [Deltaproteobacteria bacterium]
MRQSLGRWLGLWLAVVGASVAYALGCDALLTAALTTSVSVSAHELAFTTPAGTAPATQTVTASCEYYDDGFYSCSADVSATVDWITVEPHAIYGEENFTVSINPADLAPGTYQGLVQVETFPLAIDAGEDIAVTLTVTAPPE